jgi:hypothetical protein
MDQPPSLHLTAHGIPVGEHRRIVGDVSKDETAIEISGQGYGYPSRFSGLARAIDAGDD